MTRTSRRLIFYFLILVFALAVPATILYANGYSFNWEKGQFIKTGSFYFLSSPKGASVFIDEKFKDATPAYLGRLNPGSYSIRISKDGFFDWKKSLEIKPQVTTEARNILLIPKKPEVSLVAINVTSTQNYFLTPAQKQINQQVALTASSTLKDALIWTVYENNIYYLQKSNFILYRTNLAGESKTQISFEPLPEPKNSYQIKISPEQIAVFEPGGKLYLLDKEKNIFEPLAQDIQGMEFSSDNEKLLYWTDHEIWVYWLKEIFSQPYRKPDDKELINRYSDKITQTVWLAKTNEYIIYTAADEQGAAKIIITELDGRDSRNTYDIYSGKISEIYYNQEDDLLYFLTDKKLYSLDLLKS